MKKILAVILLGASGILAATTDCALNGYRYQKEIYLPESDTEILFAAPIDREIWSALSDSRADLRLATDAAPMPFLIKKAMQDSDQTADHAVASKILHLQESADNGLEIQAQICANQPISGLRIQTPLKNFERHITVSHADKDKPEILMENALIYDYTRFMDIHNLTVEFPRGNYTNLLVKIHNATDQSASPLRRISLSRHGTNETERKEDLLMEDRAFRLDQLVFFNRTPSKMAQKLKLTPYDVEITGCKTNHKEITITINALRQPLTELEIDTQTCNFSFQVKLQSLITQGALREWRTISAGTLYRVDFPGFQTNQTTLVFPEQRQAELRLIIEKGDTDPPAITSVRARGPDYRIIGIARQEPCRLLYGNPAADPPTFSTSNITVLLERGYIPASATIGPQHANPGYIATAGGWRAWLNSRWFFFAALISVALVLAFGLVRASRQI